LFYFGINSKVSHDNSAFIYIFLESTGVSTDTRKIGPGNISFAFLKRPQELSMRMILLPKALELEPRLVVIDEEAYW